MTRSGPLPYDTRSVFLGGPRVRSRTGLIVSIAAHLAIVLIAWWYVGRTPTKEPQKVITAKLVQLGKPRDEKLLPRLPTASEAAASDGAGSTVNLGNAAGPPAPDANAQKATEALARQKKLAEALAKLQTETGEGPTTKKPQEKVGREDGSAEGDAEVAEDGDRYAALVVKALKDSFIVPTTISAQERHSLACELLIFIAADGKMVRYELETPSGNPHFDRAVEATLQRANFPAPPESLRRQYASDGLPLRFKP